MTQYTVVGAGAIGGRLAAHLAAAGADVMLVDADRAHVEAIAARGLTIERPDDVMRAMLPVVHLDDAPAELGAVILAVKAQATDAAAAWIAPRLTDDGWVVSMQNGLNEATIASHVGEHRTVAAFVDLFADVIEPGVIKDGGFGAMAIGELDGSTSDRVQTLANDLRLWGSPVVSDNVQGFLWSKLGFGAMLTATALVDADMSRLIDSHRSGMHALAREVAAVASATGVELEAFDAFDPAAYVDGDADAATDGLVAWLSTQTKTRSGIWRDIAVRKRPTEVPTQYAPVLARATEAGIAVPHLEHLVDAIARLEAGEITMDESHLDVLDRIAA